MEHSTDSSAREAYRALAGIYDEFTAANNYEMWLGQCLLPELEKRGLDGPGRLLDVGCGTGRAFEPLLSRGWEVVGCDLSAEMAKRAMEKFPAVGVFLADARELPVYGEFDVVWSLNDVVNYLTEDGDLERALRGMRENLRDGGFVLFDSNSLALFRESFSRVGEEELRWSWVWAGQSADVYPGGTFEAEISGEGVETHRHRERHHPIAVVQEAMRAVGIEPLGSLGQQEDEDRVFLMPDADEERDHKIIHIGRRVPDADVN
jgi:SAM-dependent methyltransferase